MDMFVEKIIKRRKSGLQIALVFLALLLATVISVALFIFVPTFSPILIAGVYYLAYMVISRQNIEYEYIVTSGDLDIDMIINQKKRKRVFTGNAKDFELVARVKSDKYRGEASSCKKVLDYSSHNKDADVWFIYTRQNEPTVILFEPTESMIDIFHTFAPRKVFKN
jgi:hypothetical protein